jgi:predicted SnoaL-like aldol condensation-catalyzing enzyme
MTIETHKAIVQRFFHDVLKDGKMEVLEEITTPDCSYADGGKLKYTNRDDFTHYVREARMPYTHIEIILHDIIGEGDRVAVRCTYHLKTERNRYTIPVMGIFRFQENRIVEIWRNIAASEDTQSSL